MEQNLASRLMNARDRLTRSYFESIGSAVINGFELVLIPPWSCPDEGDIIKAPITSAGVIPLVLPFNGVLIPCMGLENGSERWDLPSGGVDPADLTVCHTAVRELYEETGIIVDPTKLQPLSYQVRNKHSRCDTAAVQFTTVVHLPPPNNYKTDDEGRLYFAPFPGANTDEVTQIALEPLEVFMNPRKSLLRFTHHPWAYTKLRNDITNRAHTILRCSHIQ